MVQRVRIEGDDYSLQHCKNYSLKLEGKEKLREPVEACSS